MNPQIKKLLLILIVLLLIAGGVFGWWYWRKNKIPTITEPPVVTEQPTATGGVPDQQVQDSLSGQIVGKSTEEIGDYASILNVSRYFTERYGSFSSGAAWQNLDDIKSVVTAELNIELMKLRSEIKTSDQHFSLSTKVLSTMVTSQSANQARVVMQTQKKEISADKERIFYQDITLQLVKDSDTWLVSDFDLGTEKK